jgi:hypothetical protein
VIVLFGMSGVQTAFTDLLTGAFGYLRALAGSG